MDDDFTAYAAARWRTLVHSAVLLGASHPEAEDLVQTTLTQAYVRWDKVAAAQHRDAYVAKMLVNTFRASRRRRWWREQPTDHRSGALEDHRAATADPTAAVDLADALTRALDRLPENQREVVVLRYYAHLSEAQAAEVLDVPTGTVKSRLSRAVARLAADETLTDLAAQETP